MIVNDIGNSNHENYNIRNEMSPSPRINSNAKLY